MTVCHVAPSQHSVYQWRVINYEWLVRHLIRKELNHLILLMLFKLDSQLIGSYQLHLPATQPFIPTTNVNCNL